MILEKLREFGDISFMEDYRWDIKLVPVTTHELSKPAEFLSAFADFLVTKLDIQRDTITLNYTIPSNANISSADIIKTLIDSNIWAIQTEFKDSQDDLLFTVQSSIDTSEKPNWEIQLKSDGYSRLELVVAYKVSETHIFK